MRDIFENHFFMKKSFLLLGCIAVSVLAFVSCGKDNPVDPTPEKGSYAYYDLCMDWGADQAAVISYMKSQSGWEEEKELETSSSLRFINKKTLADASYDFDSEGLSGCGLTYYGVNDKFEKMKSDLSSKFSISEWKEQVPMAGVSWWTTTLKDKKCDVAIGKSDAYGGYMYVDYTYSRFIW